MAQELRVSRQFDLIRGEGSAGPQRPPGGRSPTRSRVVCMPRDLRGSVHVRIGPGAASRQSTARSRRPRLPRGPAGEPDMRGVPA
jgi:hypothetical protein